MLRRTAAGLALLGLLVPAAARARTTFVLNHPDYPIIYSTALDQPELNGVLTREGQVIHDEGEPVIFDAFIDTGASGFVVSHLHVSGDGGVPVFGFTPAELLEEYDELGISGTETGWVTSPFGVRLLDGAPGEGSAANLGDFNAHGEHGLWVRQSAGIGENLILWTDPLNVVGMPAILGNAMVMDPKPLADQERLRTYLLPDASSAPATNVTFSIRMREFSAGVPASLSTAANPMLQNISLSHTAGDGVLREVTDLEYLFDSGASGSFMDLSTAKALEMVPDSATSVQDFVENHHTGAVTVVGGIGGTMVVPIVQVDAFRVAADEGFDLCWRNAELMILDDDHLPISGVFGMNMLTPAMTLDYGALGLGDLTDMATLLDMDYLGQLIAMMEDLLADLDPPGALALSQPPIDMSLLDDLLNAEISPGYFDDIVFDSTDPANVKRRLQTDAVPEPAASALLAASLGAFLLKRRPKA